MLIAFRNGKRMSAGQAGRGAVGLCPWTRHKVKAHVGPKLQYWAYEGGQPHFDDGYEPDTHWHLGWKSLVQEPSVEAIVNDKYMADIYVPGEYVIELQKEPVSEAEVQKRAAFYQSVTDQRCVYLCDISEFWQKRFKLGAPQGRNNYLVEWKPKRAWLWSLAKSKKADVFLEFKYSSDKLLKVWVFKGKMYAAFLSKKAFIETYMSSALKPEHQLLNEDSLSLIISSGE